VVGAGGIESGSFDYLMGPGALVMVNEPKDEVSQVPNALYGYWFTVVTTTTTGYGDVYAQSDLGMFVTTFIIVCGSLYLSVPIAVICDTFMQSYQNAVANETSLKLEMRTLLDQNEGSGSSSTRRRTMSMSGLANSDMNMVGEKYRPEKRKMDKKKAITTTFDKIKDIVSRTKVEYWGVREGLHAGIVESRGNPDLVLATLQSTLEIACAIHAKIGQLSTLLDLV
jgi:hypothetical protein